MLGPLFIFSLLAFICIGALVRPHIGAIGYYGFALLQPQWNWRWSLPTDFPYQKYIVAVTLVGFLGSGLAGNSLRGAAKNACLLLGLFLALAYISGWGSIGPARTEFYLGVLWKLVLMAVIAVVLLDSPGKIIALLWVLVLAQGYNAFQINLQYFQDGFSSFATGGWGGQGDNNGYCNVTIPLMAVSASLAVYAKQWWQKGLAWGIFVLQAHQIMLLESRGAMLGGLAMVAVFVWFVPKSKLNVGWIVTATILVGALAGPPVVKEFSTIFAKDDELDTSAESRYYLWRAGAEITRDYPLLGVGPDAGRYIMPKYYDFDLRSDEKALHNLFFELSTGVGLPATFAYLGFFAIAGWVGLRVLVQREVDSQSDWTRCASLAIVSGLIGYWVASMFSSGALFESSYACAAAGLGMAAILCRDDVEKEGVSDIDLTDLNHSH